MSILQVQIYTRQLFGVAWTDAMFQHKIDKISQGPTKCVSSASDILFVGCDTDGRDHDKKISNADMPLRKSTKRLKNKNKCHFKCTRIPFFWK